MDSIMKNIYAFNNIVVKLCEMFLCTNLLTIIFMVITVHQWYQSLYFPTNAHNVKYVQLIKTH